MIVQDNASPHTSRATRKVLNNLKVRVLHTAPGAFISLIHEGCFMVLKAKVNFKTDQEYENEKQFKLRKNPTYIEKFCAEVSKQILTLKPDVLKLIEQNRSA